jgi:crotonobetainyl-CoA:carnitine CoA-transferase CaiB-like acyl-CoA transferase
VLPLEGITAVSLEQAVALPFATRHLADLGARVVKVERPGVGDFARAYDSAVKGSMSSHFAWLNRSKESVTLELKTEGGRAVLAALVARADVFVQNLAPGATQRLGFGRHDLLARHPRLVAVDVSGYGDSGPYRDRRAYDMLVQAEAGLISVTGTPEFPAKAGFAAADVAAGTYVVQAVLAALLRRERTGRGAALEVTMLDALTEWMGYAVQAAEHTGVSPRRAGISHPVIAPYDAYPTADGASVLVGIQNDREWARLARDVIDRPELAEDPRFNTNQARVRHRAETDEMVAAGMATLSAAEATRRLDTAGIASGRVNEVTDLLDHPQLAARHRWTTVDSPVGEVRQTLPVVTFPDESPALGPLPGLGEHTDAVLAELGYSAERIAALRDGGVL